MHSTNYPKNSLRDTFNEIALLYNEIRPSYPDKLFSTLVDVTGLQKDSTLLEIGPGTGHLAAQKEVQHAFYEEIETLIHNSFQGKIDKHFSMSLTVAQKI